MHVFSNLIFGGKMMKKVLLILTLLAMASIASADMVVDGVDPGATWNGYMNVFELDMTWLWGSAWGAADLRATLTSSNLTLQSNTNCWAPEDPYWVNPDGSANKIMEGNFFQEWYGGLANQTVTFNYDVLANDLDSYGYSTKAFIKVLDPDAGWATVNIVTADLTPGAGSISLVVNDITTPVTQVGFAVLGLVSDPISPEAAAAVTIVPEPATLALLGLGGLLLRRKRS